MAIKTNTATERYCWQQGYEAGVTERQLSRFQKRDLFGFCDVFAFDPSSCVSYWLQATGNDELVEHIYKAMKEPRLVRWLQGNGENAWGNQTNQIRRAEIWAWNTDRDRLHCIQFVLDRDGKLRYDPAGVVMQGIDVITPYINVKKQKEQDSDTTSESK